MGNKVVSGAEALKGMLDGKKFVIAEGGGQGHFRAAAYSIVGTALGYRTTDGEFVASGAGMGAILKTDWKPYEEFPLTFIEAMNGLYSGEFKSVVTPRDRSGEMDSTYSLHKNRIVVVFNDDSCTLPVINLGEFSQKKFKGVK